MTYNRGLCIGMDYDVRALLFLGVTMRVIWEIDEFEATPLECAKAAWRHMRLRGSIANVFKVIDDEGNLHTIDLMKEGV